MTRNHDHDPVAIHPARSVVHGVSPCTHAVRVSAARTVLLLTVQRLHGTVNPQAVRATPLRSGARCADTAVTPP
ncbi:MAG: hypothetical protein ABF271_04640 [Abyssibacter sp.]|uniref:hypothetical protein n=1 Tax=Abyssibacter sp. TaxID=2320200 RepID=UPI00321A43B9